MVRGLSVSNVVNVTVTLSPKAAGQRNFGAALLVGASSIIDVTERIRQYASLEEVQVDFGTTTPEYYAADLHFSQLPQSNLLYIGRWAQAATPGILHGAILTPAQQLLSLYTAITTGAFSLYVDGVPLTVASLNFSAATNLNGVASLITTAIDALSTGSTCTWDGTRKRFNIISGTTGATSSLTYATAPTASGYVGFAGQPSASDTVTINGKAITFVTTLTTGNQVLIGASTAETMASLVTFINGSSDVDISKVSATMVGTKVYLVSKVTGTAGNAYSLAKSGTNLSVSGATLSGGAGTDISTLLGLKSSVNTPAPVPGIDAETPAAAVAALANASSKWYALEWACETPPTDNDYLAVSALIEGQGISRIHVITTQETGVLDGTITSDLASQLDALGYNRTLIQYSSSSPYAASSLWARQSTVNYNGNNTVITLKFKTEPGVVAEDLTETQAATADSKNCNYFVYYQNDTAIIQQGVMSGGWYIDERVGADWLQNTIQTAVYNLLYTSPTKIPQTDAGTHMITNVIAGALEQGVVNGWIAPGQWNGPPLGQIATGDVLDKGYYIYAPLVSTQSQADREARKSVPISVLVKLAGAVHSTDIAVLVER